MGHPDADLIRRGFAAFAAGDMDTLSELLADDVVWHVPGDNRWSGTYKGKQDTFGFFAGVTQQADSFENDVHAVLADDEHAVALVNTSVTVGGETVTGHGVNVFHMRGGQVSEAWAVNGSQKDLDRLWGQAG